MTDPEGGPAPDRWLVWADRINALRVFPRLLLISFYSFFCYSWLYVVKWFMSYDWNAIEDGAIALAIAGFPATVLGILNVVLATLTTTYIQGGTRSEDGKK